MVCYTSDPWEDDLNPLNKFDKKLDEEVGLETKRSSVTEEEDPSKEAEPEEKEPTKECDPEKKSPKKKSMKKRVLKGTSFGVTYTHLTLIIKEA